MGEHPLLPPLEDTFPAGDAEAYVLAVGRRFPALCKLLATLVTASPSKTQETDVRFCFGIRLCCAILLVFVLCLFCCCLD